MPMVISEDPGQITLSWYPPDDVGGTMITGYIVEQQTLLGNGSWSPLQIVYDGRRSMNQSAVVANLIGSTQYKFNVSAINLRSLCFADGSETPGVQLHMTTQNGAVPSQPKDLVASNITGGAVTISWNVPLANGGEVILGYRIFQRSGNTDYVQVAYHDATMALIRTIYGLSTFVDYLFIICAENIAGQGANSTALNVTTDYPTPPGTPKNIQQLPSVSGGVIILSWDPPDDFGGTSLQFYIVSRNGSSIAKIDFSNGTRKYSDMKAIQANQVYTYSVVAENSVLNGTIPAFITVQSGSATTPFAPTISIVQLHSGFVEIMCLASLDSGGLDLQEFRSVLKNNGIATTSYEGLDKTIVFPGLFANSNYTVDVTSVNSLGSSSTATLNFETGPAEVPGKMVAPMLVNVFGGRVTLLITPPVDFGGSPIISYAFYVNGQAHSSTSQGFNTWDIPELVADTTYNISVSAVNVVGNGIKSDDVEVSTTNISSPGPVSSVAMTSKTFSEIFIAWEMPLDSGGDTALDYEVEVNESISGTVVFNETTQALTAAITDLLPETLYLISVQVINTAGLSSWSPLFPVKTDPVSAGELNFESSWTNVSEDGGMVNLSVVRSAGSALPAICNFSTADGTAKAGVGYSATTGTLYFASGVLIQTLSIPIDNNLFIDETDLYFYVRLTAYDDVSGTIGETGTIGINILDDGDAGTFQFSNDSYYILESSKLLSVEIDRINGSSGVVTLLVEAIDVPNGEATQAVDYIFAPTNVTFGDGVMQASLQIEIINDDIYQPSKQLKLSLHGIYGRALLGRLSSVLVYILDDGDVSAPGIPSSIVLSAVSGSTMIANWIAPSYKGTANVSTLTFSVLVVSSDGTSQTLNANVDNIIITKLTARTSYAVSIAAANGYLQSNYSSSVSIRIGAPTMPSIPLSPQVAWITGGAANISWLAPLDFGGANILLYRLLLSDTSDYIIIRSYDVYGASYVLYGLEKSTVYYVTVEAMNVEGLLGHKTDSLSFTTRSASVPGKPVNATLAKATGGAIYLNLSPSLDTGGVPYRNFSVYGTSADYPNVFSEVYRSSNQTCVVAGLKYSTLYMFKYRVWNDVVRFVCMLFIFFTIILICCCCE